MAEFVLGLKAKVVDQDGPHYEHIGNLDVVTSERSDSNTSLR